VLCVWKEYVVVGVPPEIMGVGPAYAIPALLHKAGLTLQDIDVFEINEAFASQVLFCINILSLDCRKVNPQGGALALGHPLGCSGTRLVITCANYLKRTKLRYGVVSLCVGTGMGAAALIENPDYDYQANAQHTAHSSKL
jgi:acetyl-CoA acyltransferase 1